MFIYSLIFFKKLKMNLESKKYKEPKKISIIQMASLSLFLKQVNLSEYSNKLGLTQSLFSHQIKDLIKITNINTRKNIIDILNSNDKEINFFKKNILYKLSMVSNLLKELNVLIKSKNSKENNDALYRIREILNIKKSIDVNQEKWESLKSDIRLLIFSNEDEKLDLKDMDIEVIDTIKDFHDETVIKNIIWKNPKSQIPKNLTMILFVLYELVVKYDCKISEYASKKSITQSAVSHNIRKTKNIIWWEIFEQVNWKVNLTSKWKEIFEYSINYIVLINDLENEIKKMIKCIESKIKEKNTWKSEMEIVNS